jgi:hypothetical protein
MVQFIEGQDCQHLRGQQIAVQARVQCSAAATIKIGVLQWAGTEDQPTNDPVDSWAATPTWAASYSLAGSGSVALAANTWSDLRATFTLNSSFNNLAIIVWSSDALAQNATLDLSAVQIERGATATPFEVRPVGAELTLCQRYFERLGGNSFDAFGIAQAISTTDANAVFLFSKKRIVPTISRDAASHFLVAPPTGSPGIGLTALSFSPINIASAWGRLDVASGLTAGNAAFFYSNGNVGEGYIELDAEL